VVRAGDIFEVVWVSLAAAVIVSTTFSFVVLGMARSTEAARRGHGTVALAYAGLAVVCFAVFMATVVIGVNIMLTKT
jgi:CHASE2 domain-containing sensor protein